ncbi:enteropeptidase-like [Anneissia japonica]|uniref:enteropeptidase-like n=1 Tax=Anneissia japonica TaxID=1529436 RepID=UPI001425959D|nr:enteropeptidase-like [Anneissia japonica]
MTLHIWEYAPIKFSYGDETVCWIRDEFAAFMFLASVTVCGMQQTQVSSFRIVGVEDSHPGDWPWVLLYGSYDRPLFSCGASLISERWAITAAHCVDEFNNITAGITTSRDNSVFRGSVLIAETIIHPEYDAVSNDNDIALLRLDSPLEFNLFVQPICYENLEYRPGTLCYAAGWGLSLEYGTNLQDRSVFLLSIEECRSLYPEYNVTDNMICAIYTSSSVLVLFNDKGGPLMCESDDGTWNLVGVKSFEVGFMAGVYTKVSKYAEFIQQTINLIDQREIEEPVDMMMSCSNHETCQGRCGTSFFESLCHCDSHCELYGDCCYDYWKHCTDNKKSLNSSIAFWDRTVCKYNSYYLISKCSLGAIDEDVRKNCEQPNRDDFLLNIPVSDASNLGYLNLYCALCNGVAMSDVVAWKVTFNCIDSLYPFRGIGIIKSQNIPTMTATIPMV